MSKWTMLARRRQALPFQAAKIFHFLFHALSISLKPEGPQGHQSHQRMERKHKLLETTKSSFQGVCACNRVEFVVFMEQRCSCDSEFAFCSHCLARLCSYRSAIPYACADAAWLVASVHHPVLAASHRLRAVLPCCFALCSMLEA